MSIRITRAAAVNGSAVKRWYVWHRTGNGYRKQRLSVYLTRLRRLGHHGQAAAVLVQAIGKGYHV